MPRPIVTANLVRTQAAIPPGHLLLQDFNSPNDPVVTDDASIDLTRGNVFYTNASVSCRDRAPCDAPAKLALLVNDRWEITLLPTQTGAAIRELFALPRDTVLLRDLESPNDEAIANDASVSFRDGPVFISRQVAAVLTIIVNKKLFTPADGVKPSMTGREIAALVSKRPEETEVTKVVAGDAQKVALDQTLCIANGDEFEVIRCNVRGGYEPARIDLELRALRAGGALVSHVKTPTPAVIYHGLRTKSTHPIPATDVLVAIPSGYPASPLDGAYLPEGSPLLGRVPGSPQGTFITASGCRWQLVSYHPHNGGGGPSWDKNLHGFHTYYDYLLAWLRN
jgi:hypothetical protein